MFVTVPANPENSLWRRLALPPHLIVLLVFSGILLVLWSFVVPIFEGPDEPHHWQYARYVHDHWSLPQYGPAMIEANQGPLYYLLIAPFAREGDVPPPATNVVNGSLHLSCPPRFFQNCFSDFSRYWPIRLSRLLTVLISLVTVLFTYLAAREATGSASTGLLAGGLTAFLPQFTFRGTHLNNDSMVAAAAAVATYFLIRLARRGFSRRIGLLAALAVALAFLSKVNGIILVPVLAVILLWEPAPWGIRLRRLGVFLAAGVCVAPWMLRNQILYGDPTASGSSMYTAVPSLIQPRSLWSSYFLTTFPSSLWRSFIGVFGWMNVGLPEPIYTLFGLIALLAVIGAILAWRRRKLALGPVAVVLALGFLAIASTAQLNLTFTQPQGRYLFPGLAAFMIFTAIGLEGLPGWGRGLATLLVAGLAAVNLYALAAVEFPAYWVARPGEGKLTARGGVDSGLMKGGPAPPLPAGANYGQTFLAQAGNLTALEVQIATYGKIIPSGQINLHLRSNPQSPQDLAQVSIPANTVTDCSFVRLPFPPIADSQGKSYYFVVDAQGIPSGHHITLFTSATDVYPEGQLILNGAPVPRDTSFRVLYGSGTAPCPACLAQ